MQNQVGEVGVGGESFWRRIITIECLLLGLLLNGSVVSRMLNSQGTLYSIPIQAGILVLQVALIGLGLVGFLRPKGRTLARVMLIGTSTVVCVAANLVFIQIFYQPPTVRCGWRSWGQPHQSNELGFRGRSIAYASNDFVVLLMGDSQVEALGCRYERMPERLLEMHLHSSGRPAKVYSLGASGYGQDQQWIVLREYFKKRRADLVVLWETPGNDIWNNTFPTHGPVRGYAKPTFWLENGELHGPNHQLGELMDGSPIKAVTLWKRAIGKLPRGGREEEEKWGERLPSPYQPLRNYQGSVKHSWDTLANGPLGPFVSERLNTEESQLALYLTPPSPRMEYGIMLTRQLLRRIETCVQNQGGKFAIFHVVTPQSVIGEDEEVYELNGEFFRASSRQAIDTTRRLNEGFLTFKIPVTVHDWRVSESDRHLNERANDQVMGDLARALLDFIPAPAVSNQAVTKR